jgi:hypothetical protein
LRVRNDTAKQAEVIVDSHYKAVICHLSAAPGETTGYQSVLTAATWTAMATIAGESASPTAIVSPVEGARYTAVITNTSPPQLTIVSD